MNTFARPHLLRPRSGRTATKLLVGLLAAVIASVAYATIAAPAQAIVEKVGSTSVGLQPRVVSALQDGNLLFMPEVEPAIEYEPLPETFENPDANPVLHGSNVYVDYWDPTFHYHNDWKREIDRFWEAVNQAENTGENVFATDEQYTDISDVPAYNRIDYRGSYSDTTPYPASGCEDPHPLNPNPFSKIKPITCLTDAQIKAHLNSFIEAHKLPKGLNTVYYVLTPPAVAVCLDGGGESGHCSTFEEPTSTKSYKNSFCSYHGDINPSNLEAGNGETILYGVIPWTAGGWGDGQLDEEDQFTEAPYCQDGGFNAEHKEEWEGELQTMTPTQWEEYDEMKNEEKEKELERLIGGAHEQEPNQQKCPTEDGFCDVGLADLIINQLAVEQQDIVTDPLLHSWQDAVGNEVTDECRNFFEVTLGGSNGAKIETGAAPCSTRNSPAANGISASPSISPRERLNFPGIPCEGGINLKPEFNAISPVAVNQTVGFDSGESDITLNSAVRYAQTGAQEKNFAKVTWNFGDGSPEVTGSAPGSPVCEEPWLPECAESVFHSYTAGGTYTVTLTITDVGGNTASVSHQVTVIGPPPEKSTPPPPAPPAPEGGGSSPNVVNGGVTGSGNGGTTATGVSVPDPVATAAVVSSSLKTALKKGVAVHYQVNEQVAGRFEVLMGQKMAQAPEDPRQPRHQPAGRL